LKDSPVVPAPAPADTPLLFYRRGKRWPRAIAWFGFKSFWGHLWHLAASAVATEDIDCRDWMHPDEPDELTKRIAEAIGAPKAGAASLTEALDGDVWIDFVADTGDDFSVSKAVARLLFAEYEVDDPEDASKKLVLPRGHVLVFGGDTAYPVATDLEIHNRVVVPFGQVLRRVDDGRPRALLGVPGNHDWFAGLDGFGRMFRARRLQQRLDRATQAPKDPASATAEDEVDRLGQIGHFIEWVEAFRLGRFVIKRAALALSGYKTVQSASYWALRLAPDLDFWGIDRQLRLIDFHQRGFFAENTDDKRGVVLCMADPVYAFLEPNPAGVRALQSIDLSIERDGLLVLTGDTHHYCRQDLGKGKHVIAGGGGAFLHPACIARAGLPAPAAEFPGPKTTIALALQVPWQIVHGRSGFLVHLVVAACYLPLFYLQWRTGTSATIASIVTAVVVALGCVGLGGWRHKAVRIALLSVLTGIAFGFLPLSVHEVVQWGVVKLGLRLDSFELAAIAYAMSIYVGTLTIGTYLMMLTLLGLEQHQAFSALAHPGYKHFVRLRARRDGSCVDGWVLGRVDPLSHKDKVVLVDTFKWTNPQHRAGASHE
jgi:hypothetical protein